MLNIVLQIAVCILAGGMATMITLAVGACLNSAAGHPLPSGWWILPAAVCGAALLVIGVLS